MRTQANTGHEQRSAFTLLELVIVVAIIGVLAGLLFIGMGGALRGVDVTRVKAEFAQLETAMKSFETEYGVIPPSAIVLTENPGAVAWTASARNTLRRMFGANVDFSQLVDFNKDGDTADVLTLTSSECLVFFLGGMRDGTDTQGWMPSGVTGSVMTGFSRNKEKPFARGGSNRIDPPFTLDVSRLIDLDGDGMPEYRDLPAEGDIAVIYASSNNGAGYSHADGAVAHYHQSNGTQWNENSFQLISAGADGDFGFDPEPNPFVDLTWSDTSDVPLPQRDNITNFAPGTLDNN
ncbi:MAG: type II secretion system GspH family protein [Fuerstiella sp.]|nr:type II secretion system GspH family protein [Fuerstiella sp.]